MEFVDKNELDGQELRSLQGEKWFSALDADAQAYVLRLLVRDRDAETGKVVPKDGFWCFRLTLEQQEELRVEMARHGYGLDILVNDPKEWVRAEVAKQGYGLDVLMDDDYYYVRLCVADQGYGLDVLMYDESEAVRLHVALQGYGLATLAGDESERVRRAVQERMFHSIVDSAYKRANMEPRKLSTEMQAFEK